MTEPPHDETAQARMEALIAAMRRPTPALANEDDDELAAIARKAMLHPAGEAGSDIGLLSTVPRASADLASLAELRGTVLNRRYELVRILGTGGMGAVFEAKDLRLERSVAVKIIRPALASDGELVRRFLREARVASKVRHRNVVVVLDYGYAPEDLVYSVMELFVGHDLEQLLRTQPEQRLPWPEARGLLVQLASGLRAAHEQGVIHRDIKPANCFVTEEDGEPVVKLLDFGIAKLEDPAQTGQLTSTGGVLGTPSYIAPELVRTQRLASPRSDVYSLGVLAYRMLTGSLPFTGETAFEVMRRACMDPVPPLRERAPELPAEVEALVLQMLAKEPEARPADMLEVRQRLSWLGREPQGNAPVAETSVERSPRVEETLPSSGEATVLLAGAAPDAPNRRSTAKWLATGVAIVGATVAGLTWSTMRDESEPASHAPAEPTPEVEATPAPAPRASTASPVDVPPTAPVGMPPNTEPVEPDDAASKTVDDVARGVEPKLETRAAGPKQGRPRASKSPAGPPSDDELRKSLARTIEARCATEVAGERVTVSFFVTTGGRIQSMTATPKNAAGECAKQQVMGTTFRPRAEETPMKIVVE